MELNLSQSELASKVGYKDKGSISRIENGALDLTQSQIEKFAKALECSPAYLMGWENKSDNTKDSIIKNLKSTLDIIEESNFTNFTPSEVEVIEKIRHLDSRGKTIVLKTIDEELNYLRRMNVYHNKLSEFSDKKEG